MLCVKLRDDLHSCNKPLVDNIERFLLLQGVVDDGPYGLKPHVEYLFRDLFKNGVMREHLFSHLLRGGRDLLVDIIAPQYFAEVYSFAAKHIVFPPRLSPVILVFY